MINLNKYIVEKLKLNKDSKEDNKYKGIDLETALSKMMGEMMRSNVEFTYYDVSRTKDNEFTIETNKEVRIFYPQIKKYIDEELSDYYHITDIRWTLAQSKIIIEYEENK